VVVVDIELVARFDEFYAGAEPLRLADLSARPDAERLGLITGGNSTGSVRQKRNYGNRAVTEFGPEFLLDGGKIGVEVEEEPTEA
jgi:hypothetical protein